MNIHITGRGIHVSNYLQELVEKKVGKLDRYFPADVDAQVTLSVERTRQICEVTIPIKGAVLRAKDVSGDMYASIDGVVSKLEKQIQKHRTKLEKRLHVDAFKDISVVEEEEERRVVRTKRFALKPMDLEEAIMQMELVGHTFYVFNNADTQEVNVLYLRDDGQLGLIEPSEVEED